MVYEITFLSNQIVFIKWFGEPASTDEEDQFLDEVAALLENSDQVLYFLSDLSQGRIASTEALRRLGKIVQHPHFGGGTAFSKDATSHMFAKIFSRFARSDSSSEIWTDPQKAIAYLETLHPGITEGIDWDSITTST